MPYLEIVLLALIVLSSLLALAASRRRGLLMLAVVFELGTLILHMILEGPHWQMAPAYLAALLCPILLFLSRRIRRSLMAIACLTLALIGCAFSIYLPIFKLPPPTGSYAIGTQILPLVNEHPQAEGAAGADGKRALMIQIWYPASPSKAPIAPYRIRKETTLLSSYQAVVPTHARWNAPFATAQGPFPVLLLNPAWTGRRTYYMYLVEELVSHGYIVVGIDHTGNSGPIAFPDGHVDPPAADNGLDFDARTIEEVNSYGARAQKIQVEDDRFVLDQLAIWNQQPGNFYNGRFDMQRMGAFGHSFGGSVSAEIALEDPRIKAALDLDGSFWGPVQGHGIAKPLMMIEEDYPQFTPQDLKENHADAAEYAFDQSDDLTMSRSNGYRAVLHGSTHVSFTDRSLFSPFKRESGLGSIPALREYAIIRAYTVAFFNKALKGIDSPLLSPENKTVPEATFIVLHRPAELDTPAPSK
jgi:dienelactone hydrolase